MHSCLQHNTSRVFDQHHVLTHCVFNEGNMKTVGERIRQARGYRHLTAEELAHKVGYKTQSGISNLENRHAGRGGFTLPKIAQELNFALDWFLQGPDTDDMSTVPPFQMGYGEAASSFPIHRAQDAPRHGYTARQTAHQLVDRINEAGLLHVIEVLRGLADIHPAQHEGGAGLHVPAQKRYRA
jgi:transcriptional regulator with XRE-family HTH domain